MSSIFSRSTKQYTDSIITNITQVTCEVSQSRCLFVSNLLHSYYCFEYNFTVRVTWYFHENFKLNDKLALGLYPSIIYAFTIRVDEVNFLGEKFGL